MTHLQFRILIIPHQDENPNTEILQNYVERCGLYVHSMHRVELERTNGPLRPEILECVFEVLAEDQTIISNKKKAFVYKEFCLKWCQVTKEILRARPILQFCVNECFFRKRMNSHENIKLQSVSFGIQPRLGHFVEYSSVPHNPRNLIVNFFHDMKEIEVITSVHVRRKLLKYERETKYFTIKYSHIRNIFVSLDGTKFELYLDLLYTPLFFQKTFTEDDLFGSKRVNIWRTLYEGNDIKIIGKSSILKLNFLRVENILELLSCFRYRCDKAPVCFVSMSTTVDIPPALPILEFEHFGCAYMWTALTERTYTILEQSDDLRLSCEKLLRYSRENGDCLEEVLTTLLFVVDSGRLVNYWSVIDLLFASYTTHRASDDFKEYNIPRKCRLIRRATLTPTRVLLWPPDLMCENRILRNFDSEYFLRVTFRDDDLLTLNIRKNSTHIFNEAVTKHMNSGLTIGRRRYEMLAWSSSQLREHGVSMYAVDSQGRTAADIRRWTEIDPRTEMNIPKCLSRIGQCFSQTEDTIHVPMDNLHVRFERDIENRSYVFSDGIGKISMDLAAKVRNTFRQPRECSAFQIRYGGCKGMLVVDPTLKDVDIVFRESMRKFDCRGFSHTKLEIAKRSGPIPLRLNRPLITILNDLGIRKRIFLKLQEAMIQNLTDMLLDEDKAATTLLLALHRYYIDLIKTKANIDIDPDFARNMFGVIDETGKLEYGQVFVQYSSDASLGITTPKDTRILKGTRE
ncbi:hypothetical protein JTE90_015962 [Oedothorax gibbosus]|uniref:RNA-dependent RNA polymerase n=2 Tax=Oedothorax gibbosus TaxID=931172 RepID=A0AAV6TP58_9ARAC|nr:hypothetical protein JTE90_015962 [Oedothorax gibbosus]